MTYDQLRTGLLFVDPYNDFLPNGGKLWPLVEGIANEVGLIDNLRKSSQRSARQASSLHRAASSLGARRL